MSDTSAAPKCAQHPAQHAFVSCRRCGRAACAYCLPESGDGQTCSDCLVLAEQPGVIAWERPDLNVLVGFWRTTRDVLGNTQTTFEHLGAGSIAAALRYSAVLHAVLALAAMLLVSPCVVLATLGWQTPLLGPSSPAGLLGFMGASCGAPFFAAFFLESTWGGGYLCEFRATWRLPSLSARGWRRG